MTDGNEVLDRTINDLPLSTRAYNCLYLNDIKTVRQIIARRTTDLLKLKNFGLKSLIEVRAILSSLGVELADGTEDYLRIQWKTYITSLEAQREHHWQRIAAINEKILYYQDKLS